MKNGAFAEAKDFACKLSQSGKSLWQHRSNCFVLTVLPAFCIVLLFGNNYYHSLDAIVLLLFISAVIFDELFIILQAMLIEQNYRVDLGS